MPRGVYARGGILWIRWTNAHGKREYKSTDLPIGEEAKAAAALAVIKRRVEAEKEMLEKVERGVDVPLPKTGVTIAMCWNAYVNARLKDDETRKAAKKNATHGREHIIPMVGDYLLTEFKPEPHAKEFAKALQRRGLGSGYVLTLWAALHGMFKWAVIKGLVPGNPCVVEKKVLPKKRDKDPLWRRTAIYQRAEVEQLISDERLSLRDRVLNGILFLSGLRPQEMSALRFRHWDATWEPLSVLDIQVAWDSEERREKGLKNDKPRLVPVHPTLSKLLSQWRLSGWETFFGRKPKPDDLIMPVSDDGTPASADGRQHMQNDRVAKIVHRDLLRLGLRKRRAYDARRTFISLCRGDLIPKDIVRMWTHGREGEVIDLYTDIDWPTHCREMLRLNVSLREGVLLKMAANITQKRDSHWDSPAQAPETITQIHVGARGFEPRPILSLTSASTNKPAELLEVVGRPKPTDRSGSGPTVPLSHPDWESVSASLAEAAEEADRHDANALRARLASIIASLGGGVQS